MNSLPAWIKQQIETQGHLTLAFAALWIISSISMGIGLVWDVSALKTGGLVAGAAYILVLIWWFIRARPHAADLPDTTPIIRFFPSFGSMLGFILAVTIILFVLTGIVLRDGWLMLLLSIVLAFVMVIIWHRRITRKVIVSGGVVVVITAIVEQLLGDEMSSGLIMPIGTALLFLAGVLLLEHTHLTRIRLFDGEYAGAGKSFLWGCLLAVPPALLNTITMEMTPPSDFDRLFDRWWEPLYALQPGILEEIWARLFLTTLLYALLRPTSNDRPQRALLWAMGIAAVIHGLAHFPASVASPLEAALIGPMYGVPLVLLYVRRDFERAVAYHFFIDFVRFVAFVIWNSAV